MIQRLAVIGITALAVGCAPALSRIEGESTKPVATVANCIATQWNRQYPDVVMYADGNGLQVRVGVGAAKLIKAHVRPTVYGSRVNLATYHHEMVERHHPTIQMALACAN